jgi:hypothetical protein
MFASDTERRILAHLPVWTPDEDAFIEAEIEGGAATSIRSYGMRELTLRLLDDKSIPARSEDQVATFLADLQAKGFADEADGQWRMTEAGLGALGAPTLAEHEQTPGPVQIGTGG